jgi:thermitase
LRVVTAAVPAYQVTSERAPGARSVGLEALSAARPKTWAIDCVSIRRAWDVPLPPGGKRMGEGIRVAHPDSGYTRHPELIESPTTLDIASGFDFVAGDPDALDDAGFHGTGTASVLASTEVGELIGAAPRAVPVPMRVAQQGWLRPEPVLLGSGTVRLRKAIRLAIERGCHVISISLGWLGNRALHDAVREASAANIIIVAAAGNYTGPFVVWPGRYPEVVCMSGCDANRSVWGGSAFGSGVDFSAPAEDVWKAGFDGREAVVEPSSGTSFASALTAGVAALWLAHHGRQALLERYAQSEVRLTEVFRKVLTAAAREVPSGGALGWGAHHRCRTSPLDAATRCRGCAGPPLVERN